MKRHAALTTLSHDHQHALAVAHRLRQATADSADQASAAFIAFWEYEGHDHFRAEEEILLPGFAAHADLDQAAVARALVEHVVIRRDARLLASGEVPPATLRSLGERLEAHVRFEERELFPLIEASLSEPELASLGAELAAWHAR